MTNVRRPNVAGQFYPEQSKALVEMINKFLSEVHIEDNIRPKALIVPHAGYIYSGSVAATAYASILPHKDTYKNIVLVGPTHRMYFKGVAATMVDYFETPLGSIPVVHDAQGIFYSPSINVNEAVYEMEHSLEVQLPFLQVVLGKFNLIPLVVGDVAYPVVADILENLWGNEETLIIVSTDLSHYHPYEEAKQLDTMTSESIIHFEPDKINADLACGSIAVQSLLQAAKKHNLQAKVLSLNNSGDTAGPKDKVVGYGAYSFW